jgi:hypothetical protein
MVKVLELMSVGGGICDRLFSYILEFLTKFELDDWVKAVSADNTHTDFGGKKE